MNYSELFFKKDLYSITENDVIEFFSQSVEETSILEFKSGNVSIEKIYSEVAALHNSQGGLLIIGSPKPQRDNNGKEFFDGELTMSSFKNKDWLYQKLYSKISPPPVNLKIHDVRCKEGIIQILDIPKSINPPHQCLDDGKYYIRFETETKFAPHGLVEALFNRRREPVVNFDLFFEKYDFAKNPYEISIEVSNLNEIPALNLQFIIHFINAKSVFSQDSKVYLDKKDSLLITQFTDKIHKSLTGALVKGLNINFKYNIEHLNEPFIVFPTVWADNMNLIKKAYIVSPNEFLFDKLENVDSIFSDSLLKIDEMFNNQDISFDSQGYKNLEDKLNKVLNK